MVAKIIIGACLLIILYVLMSCATIPDPTKSVTCSAPCEFAPEGPNHTGGICTFPESREEPIKCEAYCTLDPSVQKKSVIRCFYKPFEFEEGK